MAISVAYAAPAISHINGPINTYQYHVDNHRQ